MWSGTATAIVMLALSPQAAEPTETLPAGFPTRRGPFAFFKADVLASPEAHRADLEWFARFDVLLTNGLGLAKPATRRALQRRGCKLFLYFWTNGFYAHELDWKLPDGTWRRDLVSTHPEWLLAPAPQPSLAGKPAYYFDLTNEALLTYLCRHLVSHRAATGYDGVFFDYAGIYALPKDVAATWDQRHPDVPYDRALARLLRELRRADPQALVFTNQAYRCKQPLLAEVDFDLAESLATGWMWGPEIHTNGKTVRETWFRPWPGAFGIEGQYGAHTAASPRKGFLYLDYMQPRYRRTADGTPVGELDREAVYYSYAAAALWGRDAFCSGWYAKHDYRGPLYFADLGRPLGDGPRVQAGLVVREYERGLVALMTSRKPAEASYALTEPTTATVYDLFASQWLSVKDGRIRLRLTASRSALSNTARPTARVYLKAKRR